MSYYDFMGTNTVDKYIVANVLQIANDYLKPHSTEEDSKIRTRAKEILFNYLDHNSGISHFELDLEHNARLVFYAGYNLLCHIFDKKKYLK